MEKEIEFREYMEQVEAYVAKMNENELRQWVLNDARQIQSQNRKSFLEKLKGSDRDFEKAKEKILKLCDKINEEEIILTCEYTQSGGYDGYYWHDDYDYVYTDEEGIGTILQEGLDIAEKMLYCRQYEGSYELFDTISCITVTALEYDAEETHELLFEELVEKGIVSTDLKQVAARLLYLLYTLQDKEARVEVIYYSYAWKMDRNIKLGDMLSSGPEPLEDVDLFITDWIRYLKGKNDKGISSLLLDAVIYQKGMLGIGELAAEFINQYPEYYVTWFEYLLEREDYDRIIQESDRVLEGMNKRFILRARIAELIYLAAQAINNTDIACRALYAQCESNPNIVTLLMLYSLSNAKELSQNIINLAEEIKYKSDKPIWLIDEQPKRIAIDESEFGILQFLNGDFEEVYNKCLKDKKALGWSSSYKGALIPLYLLMLDTDEELSELQKSVLNQYMYQYTKEMNQVPSQTIEKYFNIWKKQVNLSKQDYEKYYKWCVEEVDKRVVAIVSNTFRNAYKRAATLVVLLDGIKKDDNRGEFIRKYQAMFPRHRAFREEIKRLMENK